MRPICYSFLVLLASSWAVVAQDGPLLYPTDVVRLPNLQGLFSHRWCGSSGDIYLQEWGDPGRVIKLSPDGRLLARFSLEDAPDKAVKSEWLQSFSVDPWGNLFAVVGSWKSGKAFVVEFDDEGKYQDTVELKSPRVFPYHLAVFPTHDFLVAAVEMGSEASIKGGGPSDFFKAPFTAIFSPQGDLVKQITLPQDISRKDAAKQIGSGLQGSTRQDNALAMAVDKGGAIPGPDGNVYLARAGDPPVVFVISSRGEVIRRLVLHPPAQGLDAILCGMAAGKLIVSFSERAAGGPAGPGVKRPQAVKWYSLYDAMTGDHFMDYEASPELRGSFVCSTGNDFIFLGMQDQNQALIHAKPR